MFICNIFVCFVCSFMLSCMLYMRIDICNPHQIYLCTFQFPLHFTLYRTYSYKKFTNTMLHDIYIYRSNIDYTSKYLMHIQHKICSALYNVKYAQHCKILPHLLFFYDYLFILIFFFSVLYSGLLMTGRWSLIYDFDGIIFQYSICITLYKLIFIFHISKSNEKLLKKLYKKQKLGGGSGKTLFM